MKLLPVQLANTGSNPSPTFEMSKIKESTWEIYRGGGGGERERERERERELTVQHTRFFNVFHTGFFSSHPPPPAFGNPQKLYSLILILSLVGMEYCSLNLGMSWVRVPSISASLSTIYVQECKCVMNFAEMLSRADFVDVSPIYTTFLIFSFN